MLSKVLMIAVFLFGSLQAQAAEEVGREAARKYFTPRSPSQQSAPGLHLMALHLGIFTEDEAFSWGKGGRKDNVGVFNAGVTYRVGEWTNSMDLHMRIDFTRYEIGSDRPLKMSLLPLITFPDAASNFPLYFGAGIGAGIFFKQLEGESNLSLDYQILAGVRVLEVFGTTGFFIESGLKNHLHLLSDGQFNGVFFTGGAIFRF